MKSRIQFRSWGGPAVGALALTLLLGSWQASAIQAQSSPTFAEDIAPILYESCAGCHQPSGIGPMSLLSYEDARPYASRIKRKVASREMPPWHLDKTIGIQEYKNDISLSDAEIEAIVQWV
ncbi:MAG: cytochrome c, partial [Longimicrobiales bacterium]